MSDLIRREDAIRLAESGKLLSGSFGERAKDIIKAIPTIEERKEGEWTNAGVLTVRCSKCKSQFHELEAMNFCPNCGAKMKGEANEKDNM